MSDLSLFSLVDSEVTGGTICGLKQVSPKLQQLMVALGLWPADGWSGNIAPKVSRDPSSAFCCGVSLGLESDAVGGSSWTVKGCALPAGTIRSWLVMVAAFTPQPNSSWVPGCTRVLRPRSLQAAQSPAASSSPLVGAELPCPPPMVEVVLQDLVGAVPCLPSLGCLLVTCRVMFRLRKHYSDLQVLQAPTGGGGCPM